MGRRVKSCRFEANIRCENCKGTGLEQETNFVAKECMFCKGDGFAYFHIDYVPFVGTVEMVGIEEVKTVSGEKKTYAEWLNGKRSED